jgi:ribonucleoside-diphosphate reductase alpha chain
MRNATTITMTPTGTIGIIASASSGMAYFALIYKRIQCLDNEEMYEINPYFEKIAKEKGFILKNLWTRLLKKKVFKILLKFLKI